MIDNCSNPKCNKPLHYLRDGRIFVFEVPGEGLGADGKRARRIEHYWLCGDCSPTMFLARDPAHGVQLALKPGATLQPQAMIQQRKLTPLPSSLAS